MIIPGPMKAIYTEAKAYRPISLLPLILKTMEKLVHRHFRDKVLGLHSIY